jgi:hypothetical protein
MANLVLKKQTHFAVNRDILCDFVNNVFKILVKLVISPEIRLLYTKAKSKTLSFRIIFSSKYLSCLY